MPGAKSDKPIYVSKPFLPPREEFDAYVDKIWQSGQLTNNGPLLKEFESKVAEYLRVENFQFVTNGTLALQLAIDGLGITDGDIITTPFSYVATTAAILWQRCNPVFVDIDEKTLNIDPSKIEAAITPNTKAILAVHVFGNACDVDVIQRIADKHNLKVIYDGAHAFGAKYKGRSLLDNGDVSIVSFHATKLFHTIEGGGIISKNKAIHDNIDLRKRFGHHGDDYKALGINAKANEFQAAMGLASLKYVPEIISSRKNIADIYNEKIIGYNRPVFMKEMDYNYSYYPVILGSEREALGVIDKLSEANTYPRRYFFPSLNTIPYLSGSACPISEDISSRIICIPIYPDLREEEINLICEAFV